MKATLRLRFSVDFDLSIEWVEEGERSVIPDGYWPSTPEEIEQVAFALFPRYKNKIMAHRGKVKRQAKERERYYKKLVPEMETFEVPSHSTPGRKYNIRVVDNGRGKKIHCDCADYVWRRRRAGTHCIHIKDWVAGKTSPIAEEFAVVEEAPSPRPIRSLLRKLQRTLLTGDVDEFIEEEFASKIKREVERNKRWSLLEVSSE